MQGADQFELQRPAGVATQRSKVEIETRNDTAASAGQRDQAEQFQPSRPFFEDCPSGHLVAASLNFQFAAAAITGIVEIHVQKVHSLNFKFRGQNAAAR
jgi:hypothetical protein